jgi:hypothetical protein
MKKIYILCPVRNITEEQKKIIDDYVESIEWLTREVEGDGLAEGCWFKKKIRKIANVHYPPRDVNQNDKTGISICKQHLKAMKKCDEVHIFWDNTSKGSHFDFGMAFALGKKIKLIKHYQEREEHKSYLNVIFEISK